MKKYFPHLMFLLALIVSLAIPPLWAEPIAVRGYDANGAWVEELVDNPQGFDPATFASVLTAVAPCPTPQADGWTFALLPYVTESQQSVRLVFAKSFGEFSDLAPAPREAVALVADAEGNAVVPPEPDERGAVRRMMDAIGNGYKQTPIRSTLATAAGLYGLYWLFDSQSSGGGGRGEASQPVPQSLPTGAPNANIQGDGNVVLFNLITNPVAASAVGEDEEEPAL